MSADTNSENRGNALSDQPESIRQQMMGKLAGSAVASPAAAAGRGLELAALAAGEPRWLRDSGVSAAVERLVDALRATMSTPKAAPVATSRGDMKREYQMGPGHVEYFPTWSFWGTTFVRMINIGTEATVVLINDERFHLNPGEAHTKDGKWAAFPIRVVNTSELPGSLVSVTVT